MTAPCCRRHAALGHRDGACGPLTTEGAGCDVQALGTMAFEAKQAANAATPGPWAREMYEDGVVEGNDVVRYAQADEEFAIEIASTFNGRDAAFIAAARTDVPALAAALTAALEQLAETTRERDAARADVALGVEVEKAFLAERDAAIARAERAEALAKAERALRLADALPESPSDDPTRDDAIDRAAADLRALGVEP